MISPWNRFFALYGLGSGVRLDSGSFLDYAQKRMMILVVSILEEDAVVLYQGQLYVVYNDDLNAAKIHVHAKKL